VRKSVEKGIAKRWERARPARPTSNPEPTKKLKPSFFQQACEPHALPGRSIEKAKVKMKKAKTGTRRNILPTASRFLPFAFYLFT
jgi:hypothetical protein